MTTTEFAQIEPTTRCNFTCGFCAGRSMRQGDLSWDAFERFLAMNPGLKHVELQGEGEPLMHPRFFDMVSACRARGIKVSLISNGSMLGETAVTRLIQENVDSLHVSIESADPDQFKAIRGGKLQKVLSGIRLLLERRRELQKSRPTVGFSVTVLRETISAIPGIASIYRELGMDGGISIQLLQNMTCYTENYDEKMLQQLVPPNLWESCNWIVGATVATVPVQPGASSYYGRLFAGFDPASGTCPWLERGAYLNIEGGVTGCCFMKSPHRVFGNVSIDSPEKIDARRQELANILRAGSVPSPCSGCEVARMVAARGSLRTRELPPILASEGRLAL
jgi:MoaA/NifB/PqqE/SkfB family radical SAM enzyme